MKKVTIVVFTGVGLLLLIISAFVFVNENSFAFHAKTAEGQVVRFNFTIQMNENAGNTCYSYPVVQYRLPDGKLIEFVSSTGNTSYKYYTGEKVKVLYRPGNPEKAKIYSGARLWPMPLILLVSGIIFLGMGLTFLGYSKNRQRKR